MKVKHKVLKDFQIIIDNKVLILKAGTVLEKYICILNGQKTLINKEIVDTNPDFFHSFDWNQELIEFLKVSKVATPAQTAKKITPFIESLLLSETDDDSELKLREISLKEKAISEKEFYLNRDRELFDKDKLYNEKLHASISDMLEAMNRVSKEDTRPSNEPLMLEYSIERENYINRIKDLESERDSLSEENRGLRDEISEMKSLLSNPGKLNEIIKTLI